MRSWAWERCRPAEAVGLLGGGENPAVDLTPAKKPIEPDLCPDPTYLPTTKADRPDFTPQALLSPDELAALLENRE